MKKNILLRTNLTICILLLIGFISVSLIGYHSNTGALKKDMEHVSTLTAESIYHQIDTTLSKPVNISLTMANDSLLKRFLAEESNYLYDKQYLQQLQNYLFTYQQQYGYDSVFLVSTQTSRYYHFNGLNRTLTPDQPENNWYYEFLKESDGYALNVDNDEAAKNEITIFVNCKITGNNGQTLGIVGVGLRVNHLQELLQSYEQQYGLKAMLIDDHGIIQISSKDTGDQAINLFEAPAYHDFQTEIQTHQDNCLTFWNAHTSEEQFVAIQAIPTLKWQLVIENSTAQIRRQLYTQFLLGLLITIIISLLILYCINRIVFSYNQKLLRLTVSQELEYQHLLREAMEGFYEDVFEWDITHNCAGEESTMQYFERLGMKRNTPYHEALKVIARKQIKEEFAPGYLATFAPENVLKTYQDGRSELYYDLMITNDGFHYHWMRIRARIFYWNSDQSVRMITYRQDITAEKEHELRMLQMVQTDPLTGIYNKTATKEQINKVLEQTPSGQVHALFMIDIDHFKQVNDNFGHAAGDYVIREFASRIQLQFRETDICGRIGGDEFMVLLKDIPDKEWLNQKADNLAANLRGEIPVNGGICSVSASIGIAIYPESGTDFDTLYHAADSALYQSKERGRDCLTIYSPTPENDI